MTRKHELAIKKRKQTKKEYLCECCGNPICFGTKVCPYCGLKGIQRKDNDKYEKCETQ